MDDHIRRAMRRRAGATDSGSDLKRKGQDKVDRNSDGWVTWMQGIAKDLSNRFGQVDSDDLRKLANDMGKPPHSPNAWGAIFRGAGWKVIGRKKSIIKSNHGREIKVWRWQPN